MFKLNRQSANAEVVTQDNFDTLSLLQQLGTNLCLLNNIQPMLASSRDGKSKFLTRESVDALSKVLEKLFV